MLDISENIEDEEEQAVRALRKLLVRQQSEKTDQTVSVAVAQIKRLVSEELTTWITDSLNLKNIDDIHKIFPVVLKQVVDKHHETVELIPRQEFAKQVEDGCLVFCQIQVDQVHSAVLKFIQVVTSVLLNQPGRFSSAQEVMEFCGLERQKICEDLQQLPGNIVNSLFNHACDKITSLVKVEHLRTFRKEKYYAETIAGEVRRAYEAEMTRFFQHRPCSPTVLRGMHALLGNQFLEAFDHTFSVQSQAGQKIRDEVIAKLKADMHSSFLFFQKRNDEKLAIFQASTEQTARLLKNKFDHSKIVSCVDHNQGSIKLGRLLQMEIQLNCLTETELDSKWKSLQGALDNVYENHELEKMNKTVVQAAPQIEQSLMDHTNRWITNNLSLTNLKEHSFRQIYNDARNDVTFRTRDKNEIHPALWEEFLELIDAKCKDTCVRRLLTIHQAISNFDNSVQQQLSNHEYFLQDDHKLTSICCSELDKVNQTLQESQAVKNAVLVACNKLSYKYHDFVLIANQMKVEDVTLRTTKLYKALANVTCWPDNSCNAGHVEQSHKGLVDKCVRTLTKASYHFSEDTRLLTEKVEMLRTELDKIFLETYETQIAEKLQKSPQKIETLATLKLQDKCEENMEAIQKRKEGNKKKYVKALDAPIPRSES